MDQVVLNDILKSIKSDDLVSFATLTKGKNNLCFGRFPLLTLCYMYGAKKIIKHYFDTLCKIKIYEFVNEPFEAYKKFKFLAGRVLRLYTKDKAIVSPAEMLAILHKDNELKKKFKYFVLNDYAIKALNKIYSIYAQKVEIKDRKIKIQFPKLNRQQKIACWLGIAFGLVMSMSVVGGYGISVYTLGMGTESSPYKISSESRFYQALKSTSGNYILTKDIEIENFNNELEFSGTFDGDNHTIFIKNLPSTSFINKNNGTIKNLNIEYSDISAETNNDVGLFVGDNSGNISNVNISCNNLNITMNKSSEKDLNFAAVAITNNGTIENCTVKLNATLTGTGDGECLAGGIAATNNKDIKNCTFNEGSIFTNTIDVAGIVAVNNLLVEDCKNNASISQSSAVNGWSPNASGICMINNASIKHTINTGKISVNSTVEGESVGGSVYAAGICATNYGEVLNSLNKGEITVSSKQLIVYAGGVVADSQYTAPNRNLIWSVVDACGNKGDINISTDNDRAYVFAGGICGTVTYAVVKNCYSIASFAQGYSETKYYIGTFLGSADTDSYGLCLEVNNVYVAAQDNVLLQAAAVLRNIYMGGVLVQIQIEKGGNFNDIVFTQTAEEIMAQGVYWDE